jgi:hypothetical protein
MAWKATADFTNDRKETFWLNEYFAAHPEMMLGRMRLARGLYRNGEPTLAPDESDLGEALAQAVEKLPQNIYEAQNQSAAKKVSDLSIPAPDYIKPNAYCVHEDGRLSARKTSVNRTRPSVLKSSSPPPKASVVRCSLRCWSSRSVSCRFSHWKRKRGGCSSRWRSPRRLRWHSPRCSA